MNILIPMAGLGSRFKRSGYMLSKPLIDVGGQTMIERVINNIGIDNQFIFILNEDDVNLIEIESVIAETLDYPYFNIIHTKTTDGPARTALKASYYIDNSPLIIVNCDQVIHDFNMESLLKFASLNKADGVIGTFLSSSPKNSYVKLDPNGLVTEVREKVVISNIATNGLHFWGDGEDFLESAQAMINNKETYSGEYYIAPTYNYMIKDGKRVLPYFYNLHMPIGTPEDLEKYINEVL